MIHNKFFTINNVPIEYSGIENVDEIDIVIEKCGADFVIRVINLALRDRAHMNFRAGVKTDSLKD